MTIGHGTNFYCGFCYAPWSFEHACEEPREINWGEYLSAHHVEDEVDDQDDQG